MGDLLNFKLPKIDKSILPSATSFGIDTGSINSKLSELKDNINVDGINLPDLPDIKSGASNLIKSIPSIGNFSMMSLVPNSLLDQMDTNKITDQINKELASVDMGEFGSLQLPSDVGTVAKDIISGKGIDFSSLYTMPPVNVFQEPKLGSDFNTEELMSEINALESAANNEFDIEKYVSEFNNIDV